MSDVNLIFIEMDPTTSAATNLICLLDTELRKRYPGMPIHGINPIEFRRRGGIFLIGKLDGLAVACGALRPLSRDAGEVKRMFVRKDQRGKGFGGGMLNALEQIAIRRGYQSVRLETGANQPEAIRLYQGMGYRRIPCSRQSSSGGRTWCFEKVLPRLFQQNQSTR